MKFDMSRVLLKLVHKVQYRSTSVKSRLKGRFNIIIIIIIIIIT
jgi:hypothetical protein